MKYFAVVGNPILHSKSPLIFTSAYPLGYSYIRILSTSANDALEMFWLLGLDGMNITAPFKNINLWGDGIQSAEVKHLGVVNTIVRNGNKLFFHNTDVNCIDNIKTDFNDVNCVVLGAGGAAAAAGYALTHRGANVTLVNRTLSNAENLAKLLHCKYADIKTLSSILPNNKFIFNCLNVNILNLDIIEPFHTVIDAIYHDSPIKELTHNYIDGCNWLINQGVRSYELFTSITPNTNKMQEAINIRNTIDTIVFIGKSPLAKEIYLDIKEKFNGSKYISYNDDLNDLTQCRKLKQENIVIWLYSEMDREDIKYYIETASLVVNTANLTKNILTKLIYEEISNNI